MKKYFKVANIKEQIKVETGYEKGGYNYFNGQNNRRGYYAYVRSVTIKEMDGYNTESYIMFDGFKEMLQEVKRQSKKVEAECDVLAEKEALRLAKILAVQKGWILEE